MKNNLIIGVLVGMLGLSALISLVLSFRVIASSREWTRHQPALAKMNIDRAVAQNLYYDLVEYSKTHPSIEPLLSKFGNRTNQPASPATR